MREIHILTVPVFSSLCNLGFRLRHTVFVEEQGVPSEQEFDQDDLNAIHIVAISEGEVIGTLRVIRRDEHFKIGRVVVAIAARGKGVASRMLENALEYYEVEARGRFYLTAQTDKVRLYGKFGFKAFGAEFFDGGIPHIAMKNY